MDKKNWYNIVMVLLQYIVVENKMSEKEITLPDFVPHADTQTTNKDNNKKKQQGPHHLCKLETSLHLYNIIH